ncbi:XRE family transcriptional regulator [Pedobacter yulinensis]|uniref:methylated-DNA--[protein]-cysteine S-methyltransferase n=1 Tax=Pedobacter yulinensis TaxID=2126353 RepID=A0A2T3HS14_9SPHI|nr:methylated-DNA--[protein]-cysteine S-methyltransferase [Pedobacter yulinensis]PST85191.1 XRE family transcriptional regulator [Pedobacter yulinensis]
MNTPTEVRYYQALLEKDTSFEGTFIAAVKTTGVFCRPSCRARKPRPENVTFFPNAAAAMMQGYRPCKVCRPLEPLDLTPPQIGQIIGEIAATPAIKITNADLQRRGLDPVWIRRWFLKHHGLTFHAYQRMNRINNAFNLLKEGLPVTQAAFESGYDSLSGFGDTFKTLFGDSPVRSRTKTVIFLKRLSTPLGTMIACAAPEGICLLEFSDRKMLETELQQIRVLLQATIIQAPHAHFDLLEAQLTDYFNGALQQFSVPLVMPGTDFQRRVWQELLTIPYGQTRTYKTQAVHLGQAHAVRAVGRANGMNRISILVPCHRVIGENGLLTGYGGGVWRKQQLLTLERRHADR